MKSTIKVFQVLETLCEGKAAGVTELSNQLGIKPSSMHRFLAVLTKLGYVQKNASSKNQSESCSELYPSKLSQLWSEDVA